MRTLDNCKTHELVAELLDRLRHDALRADRSAGGVASITVPALRALRNLVIAELDSRYPHLLDG